MSDNALERDFLREIVCDLSGGRITRGQESRQTRRDETAERNRTRERVIDAGGFLVVCCIINSLLILMRWSDWHLRMDRLYL